MLSAKEANKTEIFLFFSGPFKNQAHAQGLCCYKHLEVKEGHPRGGGSQSKGGILSFFSSYVGSGPASTIHPKNIKNFKHPKNILNFSNPKKYPPFGTLIIHVKKPCGSDTG